MNITTNEEKKYYAVHLVDRFGSTAAASQCIEEMLKVCPDGSDKHDLMATRRMINDGTFRKSKTSNT